ncbi:MAG TPA: hypothetical protein VKP78_08715 [bacterium]|nr:hypothetical protein [bacterium]
MARPLKTMTIRCDGCKNKLFKYHKVGKGNLIKMYKSKIKNDNAIYKNGYVFCSCGKKFGRDEGNYIKVYGTYKFE